MTEAQDHILRHALGITQEKGAWRRHFVTGPGSKNFDDCQALAAQGLLKDYGDRGGMYGGDHLFLVTQAGAAAVGSSLPSD